MSGSFRLVVRSRNKDCLSTTVKLLSNVNLDRATSMGPTLTSGNQPRISCLENNVSIPRLVTFSHNLTRMRFFSSSISVLINFGPFPLSTLLHPINYVMLIYIRQQDFGTNWTESTASRWCPGADSNHRHADFQSAALPTELPGLRQDNGPAARTASRRTKTI